ncbi:hypothetical protein V2G26_018710 [Clonostachys chloroleuca]
MRPKLSRVFPVFVLLSREVFAAPIADRTTCRKTQVAILGAGIAGVTAAQAVSNASITDFLLIDRNDYIGGRVLNADFGKKPDGSPYTIELGANWIQGLGSVNGPENPIWTLSKKYSINSTFSNYSAILSYDETGQVDYLHLLEEYDRAYEEVQKQSGYILNLNLQDTSVRTGLSLAGWNPQGNSHAQAVEWWGWDFNAAQPPELSSLLFGVAGDNATFNHFSDENFFVTHQNGLNEFIQREAHQFLRKNDPRILLNTTVISIQSSEDSVEVHFENGDCVEAEHVICTFSIGVLQNNVVEFKPELPLWKRDAIQSFNMGIYTKIFMQFNETFWDEDTQFFLYADPYERGKFPVFQSLTGPEFHENSHIIFVTVAAGQAQVVDKQTDEETQAQVMEVLRSMFPNVNVPDPIAFMYPRWSEEKWAYGSYSNWPVGVTLEKHQNLRANVDRLWFAGEASSSLWFGYMQGAWFEGQEVGQRVAGMLGARVPMKNRGSMRHYNVLHGTSFADGYDDEHGWNVDTFADQQPRRLGRVKAATVDEQIPL